MDYAKGICILMPVYRHTFEGLGNVGIGSYSYNGIRMIDVFTMGFRMPVFFMIAGAFFASSIARKGVGGFMNGRFRTVLYPLMIWGGIQITLQMLFAGAGVNAQRTPLDYLNLILDPRKLEQFWYLNALFFVSTIYALLHYYAKFKIQHQLGLALVFYVISSYCERNHIYIGFLSGVTFYYIFFCIGDALHKVVLDEKNHEWLSSFRTSAILVPVFVAIELYCTSLNLAHPEESDFYVQYYRQEVFLVSAVIGAAFMIHLAFLLQRFNSMRWLRVVGYHAIYIYLSHMLVTAGMRILLVNIMGITNIPLLICIIYPLGIILPMIGFNIARRLGATWIFTLREDSPAPKPKPATANTMYFTREAVVPRESGSNTPS